MHTCDDQSMQEHNNEHKRLKLFEISESMLGKFLSSIYVTELQTVKAHELSYIRTFQVHTQLMWLKCKMYSDSNNIV